MAGYGYDRLSAQDSSFLIFERGHTHMHLGGVLVFESGPLATPDGGVDIQRIRAYIASRLHQIPRYRQRLGYVPLENHPVWIDDDHFNLGYHVRHTALPRPGDEHQLKRLAGRVFSQPLDRARPLWEAWIVEGLEGGRWAMIVKTHHCMADGVSAVDLVTVLLSAVPDTTIEEPARWIPRPPPTGTQLVRDEALRRLRTPVALATGLGRALRDPARVGTQVIESTTAAWRVMGAGLHIPADTPMNGAIGPHRRFDWLAFDLEAVKAVKHRLGGTVNDVGLATVAGAVRRFLRHRRAPVDGLDYRIVVPVSVRTPEEQGTGSNRASAWLMSLPVQERDARRRYERVQEMTAHLKASKQALGAEVLIQFGELAGFTLVALGTRLTARLHPYHLIVTNIPGPQLPLYCLGARLSSGYPQVPLFENQGLGIAIFSYAGQLFWGFNADWDLMPDLHAFVEGAAASFRELERGQRPAQDCDGTPVSWAAAGEALGLAVRPILAPAVLATRWAGFVERIVADEVPVARASLALAAKVALDELFFLTEALSARFAAASEGVRVLEEVAAALPLFEGRGWLTNPVSYHRAPAPFVAPALEARRSRGLAYLHLQAASEYEPHADEPGRLRWMAYAPNHTAHAWILRHPGPPRPWLLCVHGYRMGFPLADFLAFPATWLHHDLGLNLAFPILPFHGPRTVGWRTGDGFLSGDLLDAIHLQAQAVWDVRRLLGWLRADGAPAVGVYGLSLGAYTAALVAALDPDLACIVAGVPPACWLGLARWNVPGPVLRFAEHLGFFHDGLARLLRAISPLAIAPRVPHDRRYLYAAIADRLVPPAQARDLWRHWERPRMVWYEGSHVSFGWQPEVRALLAEAVRGSGLAA